ncbi:MAG TPA: MOSC N-terminal beta barrel domain-containing protein [Sphingomicrobium sp.]|nr:MOSC N-terminal beta barrel domain-containing protein [Sphingomicrobium sp.]
MSTLRFAGSVKSLWRFPVKSMGGERLERAEVSALGLLGDRAHALIDVETGKVVSAKSVKHFPDILAYQASSSQSQPSSDGSTAVEVTFPDGTTSTSGAGDIDRRLSRSLQREVTLARTAPEDYTIDQYHPDIEHVDPAGYRDTVVEQKLGSAFFDAIGAPSPVPVGAFFDLFPISVMTTSTLRHLNELQPGSRFDERRFRMNLIVETTEEGFVENDWVGRELAIGNDVRLRITMPDPRCVMTTLAQDGLPRDPDVLRTITRHNRLAIGPDSRYPCAGVYAVVEAPGTIRMGDSVSVA